MALSAWVAACLAGCGSLGQFVWVDQYRDPRPSQSGTSYVLAAGNIISVRVFNEDALSVKTRIRTDGKISMPLLNDVQAEGYEPAVLAQQLEVRLKDYKNKPVVTVTVEEPRLMEIAVVGLVGKPG